MGFVLVHILSFFPHLHFKVVFERIVSQLEVEDLQYLCLHFQHIWSMFAVDPISQFRRIYLFVLHRHEETGLRYGDSLKLIADEDVFIEVEVEVEHCQMEGGSHEVESVADLEHVPD